MRDSLLSLAVFQSNSLLEFYEEWRMNSQRGSNLIEVSFVLVLIVGVAFTSLQALRTKAGSVIDVFGGASGTTNIVTQPNITSTGPTTLVGGGSTTGGITTENGGSSSKGSLTSGSLRPTTTLPTGGFRPR